MMFFTALMMMMMPPPPAQSGPTVRFINTSGDYLYARTEGSRGCFLSPWNGNSVPRHCDMLIPSRTTTIHWGIDGRSGKGAIALGSEQWEGDRACVVMTGSSVRQVTCREMYETYVAPYR